MVWALISASFSTFTYMSAEMPIPASPLSLHPFVSSVFLVLRAHPMLKRRLSLFLFLFFLFYFLLPITFCISSFRFCALFPWVIATCTLILLWLPPPKNKHNIVAGSERLWMEHMKSVRSFSSSSLGSNIHLWHQCMGSNFPRDMGSKICPLFPQVTL